MPYNPVPHPDHPLPFLPDFPQTQVDPHTGGRTLGHVAPIYDYLAPLMTLGTERIHRHQVLRELHLSGTERVLDVGCGTGALTRRIASALTNKQRSLVLGIDAASAMIAVARRKAQRISNIRFETAVAENLPFPDGSFDRAVSTMFFHHVNADLKRQALAEIWRILTPTGRALIVDVAPPTNLWGAICAWSGYWLFKQPEIRENIEGKLEIAFHNSPFSGWRQVAQYAGYIRLYELTKQTQSRSAP